MQRMNSQIWITVILIGVSASALGCQNDTDCGGNGFCRGGRCGCYSGYQPDSTGICRALLGVPCANLTWGQSTCLTEGYLQCGPIGRCECKHGYFVEVENPGVCKAFLGQSCRSGFDECLAGASCNNGRCSCTDGHVPDDTRTVCEGLHGASCSRLNCKTSLRLSCINRRCECNIPADQKFDRSKNVCVSRAGKECGRVMGWDMGCVDNSDCKQQKNGTRTCVCEKRYSQNYDGDCVRERGGNGAGQLALPSALIMMVIMAYHAKRLF